MWDHDPAHRPAWEAPRYEYHSYFDGEADGVEELEWPEGGVLEEQLFWAVRSLPFEVGYARPVRVAARQLSSRAGPMEWRAGELEVVDRREVEDARGQAHEVWHVEVRFEGGGEPLTYDVSTDEAHHLIAHTGSEQVSLRLKDVARWAYWDRSNPPPFEGAGGSAR